MRSFLNDPVSGSEVTILGFRRSSGVTLGHFKSSENILTTFFDLSGLFLGIPENLKKKTDHRFPSWFFEDFWYFSRLPGVTLGHLKSSWNILTIFFDLSG